MRTILSLCLLVIPGLVISQTETSRGLSPETTEISPADGDTWALVVGISDYQHPDIPDLKYAHRDAEFFAAYLQTRSGDPVDPDRMRILLDSTATEGNVMTGLIWLIKSVQKGDRVILYFAGHGDVDQILIDKSGYLLCTDANGEFYAAGGTVPMQKFQAIISTLSAIKSTEVLVITDACHAGHLAGQGINGVNLTGDLLAQQIDKETKILSCQPNERSKEGPEWGGGRGVFSYYLIKGLQGAADQPDRSGNRDGKVILKELDRYLEDNVSEDVSGQNPKSIYTDPKQIISLAESSQDTTDEVDELPNVAIVAERSARSLTLPSDPTIRSWIDSLELALQEDRFTTPDDDCAELYVQRILAHSDWQSHWSSVRLRYAAALQDGSQQVMNRLFRTDRNEIDLSTSSRFSRYAVYPDHLERAVELLESDTMFTPYLRARKAFFEGYLLALENQNHNPRVGEEAISHFQTALEHQPHLPHAYWQMAMVYGLNMAQPDSAIHYAELANAYAPAWELPLCDMAYVLMDHYSQLEKAQHLLERAEAIDKESPTVWNAWGLYAMNRGDYAEARRRFEYVVEQNPESPSGYINLANICRKSEEYQRAIELLNQALELDPESEIILSNLGLVHLDLRKLDLAEQYLVQSLALNPNLLEARVNLGITYRLLDRIDKAVDQYRLALDLAPTDDLIRYKLAEAQFDLGELTDALSTLNAIQNRTSDLKIEFLLGRIHYQREEFPEAEQAFRKAIVQHPDHADTHMLLGYALFYQDRKEDALSAFRSTTDLNDALPNVHFMIGKLLKELEDAEAAIPSFRKALEFEPENLDFQVSLARACSDAGQPDQAEQEWNKVVGLNPELPDAYFELACIRARKGEIEQAFDHLDNAVRYAYSPMSRILQDPLLQPLRSQEDQWKDFLLRHELTE